MAEDDLLFDVADGVARVTINRPGARNSITFAMYERLTELCHSVARDRSIKALIVTGAGGQAFSAGTDISEFRAFAGAEDGVAYERLMERVLGALEECPVPTIAAVAGSCTGGGCAIAACCDLRVASPDARFGFPMARTLGNCLSLANIARIHALVGPARVIDLLYTARLVPADEAKAIGLVTEVTPDAASLPARAEALARLVAGHAPLTLRATKEAVRRLRPVLGEADDIVRLCYGSRDFREGMEAFLAKRRPDWRGE